MMDENRKEDRKVPLPAMIHAGPPTPGTVIRDDRPYEHIVGSRPDYRLLSEKPETPI
jgi:hypothetical protein